MLGSCWTTSIHVCFLGVMDCNMPDHCCIPLCTNRRNKQPNLSFHTFPRNPDALGKWIVAIRQDEGSSFRVTVNTIVYSAQFKDEDYFGSRSLFFFLFRRGSGDELYDTRSRKRRLKPDAVPTIFFFFCFRGACCDRPSPSVRRRVAQDHVEKLKLGRILVRSGH